MAKKELISTDRVAVGVAIISIGLTIAISSINSMYDSFSKHDSAIEYKEQLNHELGINKTQAEAVIELSEKKTEQILQPRYQTSVYNAGLNNGLFYKLDKNTRYLVPTLYAIAETDNNSIELSSDEDRKEVISFQALKYKLTSEKFLAKEISVDKFEFYLAYLYLFLTILGSTLAIIGIKFALKIINKV